MFEFSLRLGEKILIGENIVLKLNEIRADKVRIAIDAPRDVPVLRAELASGSSGKHE